jgi:hypothetical protein
MTNTLRITDITKANTKSFIIVCAVEVCGAVLAATERQDPAHGKRKQALNDNLTPAPRGA